MTQLYRSWASVHRTHHLTPQIPLSHHVPVLYYLCAMHFNVRFYLNEKRGGEGLFVSGTCV